MGEQNFKIIIGENGMKAELVLIDPESAFELDQEAIEVEIEKLNIVHGLKEWQQEDWREDLASNHKVLIAEGTPPVNGENGKFIRKINVPSMVSVDEKSSFRDVTVIPVVTTGELLGEIIPPTNGTDGRNILGNTLKAKPGKRVNIKAGKNVAYHEEIGTFTSTLNGQVSYLDNSIHVFPVYEVNDDLSLSTGNINFIGSVVIKGDVPSGFEVKADGDITIYGTVEASKLESNGNIFVSEGIAGMEKGYVTAKGDIETGYINQSYVEAGQRIRVKKAIMHSTCIAQNGVICENGSIIGGSTSTGNIVDVKNIGNVASTKTEVVFGAHKKKLEKANAIHKQLESWRENRQKLAIFGQRLQQKKNTLGLQPKEEAMLVKQKEMINKISQQLADLEVELEHYQSDIGNLADTKLIVRGNAFENVELHFGKYKRVLSREYNSVIAVLDQNEIIIRSIHDDQTL
ncbi:hypothetical protein GGQ92_000231 [Gracilibacillus halotolerans]|uniref:Flagellar Assembly Protein A N-terminal region domain-containing protein n=1 Tax=Gracilibacillus halotolerans TaxID=74386 RepID=A0A841RKG5_9BACI|nr:FapA family protein [Gracilibacillus halotolerans]MBB6511464.1 hypothetical protein [Gracilibacillus halotolerans]